MKKILENIDFADSNYKFCKTDENDNLSIYVHSWNEKNIQITFKNAIRFTFNGGSFLTGIYEEINESSYLTEALSTYYEKMPKIHPFKFFKIIDIEDKPIFEIVAEGIEINKGN